MSAITKNTSVNVDEFCELVEDGEQADLIDGVIYIASPDNTPANRLNGWLDSLISIDARERELGETFVSRVAFRLDSRSGPEPDMGSCARTIRTGCSGAVSTVRQT